MHARIHQGIRKAPSLAVLHDQRHQERDTGLRKIIKTRGHFPGDDATTKLIWLALRNISEDWGDLHTTGRPQ